MSNHLEHIYPIFDKILQKEAKETLLGQKGMVFWVTGLSGSGKSTVAEHAEAKLFKEGIVTQILDGDNIRSGLNKNLSFSAEDRIENIRRIAEVAKLFANCGIVAIASFISPTIEIRQMAKDIIGEELFCEVYINTPLEECESRDVKGLYKKALNGEIKNFTGLDSPFEAPINPFIEVKTHEETLEQSTQRLLDAILEVVKYSK